MATISIEDAQEKLAELIRSMSPGDEVIITANDHPVAKLTPTQDVSAPMPRQPGTLRGTVLHYAADFNASLNELKEYAEAVDDVRHGIADLANGLAEPVTKAFSDIRQQLKTDD